MGATKIALVVALLAARAGLALADESCTGVTAEGAKFETCFDLGNRLSVTAGSDGFGIGIQLRQLVKFDDDPDLNWKLEHGFATIERASVKGEVDGLVYGGHFLRHTRDGHIVLPGLGTPRKVFLPFDIGAVVEAGRVTVRDDMASGHRIQVGMVKTAPVIDLWRSRDFRRRLVFGPVARWDIGLSRDPIAISRHIVAPFSMGMANFHAESRDGLYAVDLAVEGGTAWTSDRRWTPLVQGSASLERIVLAINERPIALLLGVKYDSEFNETIARIGARIVLFHAADSRVAHL